MDKYINNLNQYNRPNYTKLLNIDFFKREHFIISLHRLITDDIIEFESKLETLITNDLANSNLGYFTIGENIINLRDYSDRIIENSITYNLFTKEYVNKSENLFIFSKEGYLLLPGLLGDDVSKLIYKSVVRDYFGKKEFLIKCSVETNYIYKLLFGKTAKQIKSFLDLDLNSSYDTIRNYLYLEDIDDIRAVEGRIAYMAEDGHSYQDIQARLKELYPIPRDPKLADKNISLINNLMFN